MTYTWWWLSFIDPEHPVGEKFLGAVILQAGPTIESAAKQAWHAGLNPGGEVAGRICPNDLLPPEEYRGRLLDREQATLAASLIDTAAARSIATASSSTRTGFAG